ncbi:MAG: hypothetical protein GDA50_05160 [Alphaproteobacteria bacterium GM202ARS2]|nr:hypothetical protein [Alphaproteobacteria bacterium GM202ARS2]
MTQPTPWHHVQDQLHELEQLVHTLKDDEPSSSGDASAGDHNDWKKRYQALRHRQTQATLHLSRAIVALKDAIADIDG